MNKAYLGTLSLALALVCGLPSWSEPLQGKFVGNPPGIPEAQSLAVADLQALTALQSIKSPLQARTTLYEYAESIRKAQLALDIAAKSETAVGLEPMRSAIETHLVALRFWQECLMARNDFQCDEKRPSVAEVLRRYPIPREIETISRRSVVEAIERYPKPWVMTRIRYTLREVVEYIPPAEQRKAFKLLLQKAAEDTQQAAIALDRT